MKYGDQKGDSKYPTVMVVILSLYLGDNNLKAFSLFIDDRRDLLLDCLLNSVTERLSYRRWTGASDVRSQYPVTTSSMENLGELSPLYTEIVN